jgi:NADH:ubiquinone reductase (non-electrogenic)
MLAKREAAAVTSDVTVSTSTVDTATIFDKVKPFAYHHKGSMAYVGSGKAVADLPSLQQDANDAGGKHSFHGDLTYWAWRSVYMSKLLSFTKRMAVGTDWVRTSAFGRDTSRHE